MSVASFGMFTPREPEGVAESDPLEGRGQPEVVDEYDPVPALLAMNGGDARQTFIQLRTDVDTLKLFLSGLTSIDVSSVFDDYTDAQRRAAIGAIAMNKTLEDVDLSHNPKINDADAAELARNDTITSLRLSGTNIGDAGAAALARNTRIIYLSLCENKISHEGAIALAKNSTVRSLSLDENKIGDSGAAAFATSTVTSLSMNDTGITSAGAVKLADNKTVWHLQLDGNAIGAEGIIALAANKTIRLLRLQRNGIGLWADGVNALRAFSGSAIDLDLSNNAIGDAGCAALSANRQCTALLLESNGITDAGVAHLATLEHIEHLHLGGNRIGDRGLILIAGIKSLLYLHMGDQIDNTAVTDVGLAALLHSTELVEIRISRNFVMSDGVRAALSKRFGLGLRFYTVGE